MKAIVLVLPDDVAEEVGRLIDATLHLNGYRTANEPQIIDWPYSEEESRAGETTASRRSSDTRGPGHKGVGG